MANPQLPAGYEFNLTVDPTDIEGNPVADSITWTGETGGVTLTVDDSTTLVVTVAAPAGTTPATGIVIPAPHAGGVTATYTFDVVADVAAAFTIAASTPVKIPAAA
jgi:hypothetical protein